MRRRLVVLCSVLVIVACADWNTDPALVCYAAGTDTVGVLRSVDASGVTTKCVFLTDDSASCHHRQTPPVCYVGQKGH